MAILGFLARFGQKKVQQTGQTIAQTIIAYDPETASEVQTEAFERYLAETTDAVPPARASYQKEQQDVVVRRQKYDRLLDAAEVLKKQLVTAKGAKKDELETSLNTLVTQLTELDAEIKQEEEEARLAKETLDQVEAAAKDAAERLKQGRKALERKRNEMTRVKLQRQQKETQAENAAVVAGLKKKTNSLTVVLDTMDSQIQKERHAAEAADLRAKLINESVEKLEQDPNIAKALEAVDGSKPGLSATERLAALKKNRPVAAAA